MLEERDHLSVPSSRSDENVLDLLVRIVERNAKDGTLVWLFATAFCEATTEERTPTVPHDRYVRLWTTLAARYGEAKPGNRQRRRIRALATGRSPLCSPCSSLAPRRALEMACLSGEHLDGYRAAAKCSPRA